MPDKTLVRLAGGLSLAFLLQLSLPALAQSGQSDWIHPAGSSADSGSDSGNHLFGKHKKQVFTTPGQSGWITPSSNTSSDGNAMLNVGGAGSDMLEGTVNQNQYAQPVQSQPMAPMQQQTMMVPMQQQTMMAPMQQQTMMTPMPQQTMMTPMPQQTMMAPMQQQTMMAPMPVQQTMMVPVQQQAMTPVPQQTMMVPMQQQTMMVPVQQPAMMVPMQQPMMVPVPTQTTVLVPVQVAPAAQAAAPKSDDSLASVVFGAPKGTGDSSGSDPVSKALVTAAEVGMIGSQLGSTVGPALEGLGFDNHFHTYGAATCGTFYADGSHRPGYYTTSGNGLGGVGNGLIRGVERGVDYGATEGSWLLMNKLMSGH